MKVLITNNHFSAFAGSAIVALEVAQVFQSLGYKVSLCAAYVANPLKNHINELGYDVYTLDTPPHLDSFDVIWAQNHILTALIAHFNLKRMHKTRIFSVSLSPYDGLELPGSIVNICERVIANSYETATQLIQMGISDEKLTIFNNAVPDDFITKRSPIMSLKKIMIVSNHTPHEIINAIEFLENKGIEVTHIGFFGEQKLVTPEMITKHDAVVTIGKTVQYAIQSETPVFIYDHFGGPGWLSVENAEKAAYYNFSGRCCRRKLNGHDLANEIYYGHGKAASETEVIKNAFGDQFNLSVQISQLLAMPNETFIPTKEIMDPIIREGVLAAFAAHQYKNLQINMIKLDTQNNKIKDLEFIINNKNLEILSICKEKQRLTNEINTMKSNLG